MNSFDRMRIRVVAMLAAVLFAAVLKLNFWLGMFAPAKTPPDTLDMLSAAMTKALGNAEVIERMKALAFEPRPTRRRS